ncbi:unnamed protein product [Bemisia tabaci]|uniref:Uncharacterized protein n=1 Tax=Bemisia tabaci TaxID=7038 RepID=A0A9N9ZYF7_BEMTA|nr:unnamed protein product [Bemisia tabaci]
MARLRRTFLQEDEQLWLVTDKVHEVLRHKVPIGKVAKLLACTYDITTCTPEETWSILRGSEDAQLEWIVSTLVLAEERIQWKELSTGIKGEPLRRLYCEGVGDEDPGDWRQPKPVQEESTSSQINSQSPHKLS